MLASALGSNAEALRITGAPNELSKSVIFDDSEYPLNEVVTLILCPI